MTPAGSVQTLLHPNQDCLSHGNPPAKNAGHCSARQAPLAGASANESTGHVPGDSLARATAPSQVSQPSPIGSSTEHHSLNYRMNGPSTDTIERGLAEEGMVRSCVVKRPQAQVRPHRPWKDEDLNRLPRWFMARKHLPKNILEVEFLEDFKHHRTPSAISAACRKRMKAEARLKNATSRCTPISPPRAVPVALESTQISQTLSTIAGHKTPGLNPPHISSKEMGAPGNPSLERPRSRRTRLQIPESRERSSFAHSSFTCGDEEADGTTSSASVGSTCAPAQSAVSQPIRDADESPGSGNQKDVPPGRFGEVNDGKDQRTRPNMESAAPRAQVEREGLRAPHGGQRNWQKTTPPERLVWQELNGQNELQISSPQSKFTSFSASRTLGPLLVLFRLIQFNLIPSFWFILTEFCLKYSQKDRHIRMTQNCRTGHLKPPGASRIFMPLFPTPAPNKWKRAQICRTRRRFKQNPTISFPKHPTAQLLSNPNPKSFACPPSFIRSNITALRGTVPT